MIKKHNIITLVINELILICDDPKASSEIVEKLMVIVILKIRY